MLRARRGAGLAAGVAALLLSGCSLTGDVVVHTSGRVDVDLTYTPKPGNPAWYGPPYSVDESLARCQLDRGDDVPTLEFARVRYPGGSSECRITGWARVEDIQRVFGVVSRVGDEFQVEFYPDGPRFGAEQGTASQVERLDVAVTFPGPVGYHLGGRVAGTTVLWADPAEFAANGGLAATGASEPAEEAPPGAVPAEVATGAAGLGLGLVLGVLIARRGGRRLLSPASSPPPAPGVDEDWSHD